MRALLPFLLVACSAKEITYEELASGTYSVTAPDGALTLTLDVDGGSYTLSDDAGVEADVEGTLSILDEESWTTCCYLNGSGHTKFETVSLSGGPLTMGGLDLAAPHVSADGPTLFEADGEMPEEAPSASEAYTLE